MADADGRLLERAVARADGPPGLLQRGDDRLRRLALGELEAGHGPAAASFAWQIRDAVLLAPLLDATPHGVMTPPPRFHTALALDPAELRVQREQQGDGGRVGRLVLGGRLEEAHEIEVLPASRERVGALDHALRGDTQREPRRQREGLLRSREDEV